MERSIFLLNSLVLVFLALFRAGNTRTFLLTFTVAVVYHINIVASEVEIGCFYALQGVFSIEATGWTVYYRKSVLHL